MVTVACDMYEIELQKYVQFCSQFFNQSYLDNSFWLIVQLDFIVQNDNWCISVCQASKTDDARILVVYLFFKKVEIW